MFGIECRVFNSPQTVFCGSKKLRRIHAKFVSQVGRSTGERVVGTYRSDCIYSDTEKLFNYQLSENTQQFFSQNHRPNTECLRLCNYIRIANNWCPITYEQIKLFIYREVSKNIMHTKSLFLSNFWLSENIWCSNTRCRYGNQDNQYYCYTKPVNGCH